MSLVREGPIQFTDGFCPVRLRLTSWQSGLLLGIVGQMQPFDNLGLQFKDLCVYSLNGGIWFSSGPCYFLEEQPLNCVGWPFQARNSTYSQHCLFSSSSSISLFYIFSDFQEVFSSSINRGHSSYGWFRHLSTQQLGASLSYCCWWSRQGCWLANGTQDWSNCLRTT